MKLAWKPGTLIYPIPAAMISCGNDENNFNIITVSWTGTICTEPPMCYISLRKSRHSHKIIEEQKEFVINIPIKGMEQAADWCGVKSGRDFNKFKEMKLTPVKGQIVKAPLINESPLNIECVVKEIKELGSHDMFIAEVVAVNVNEELVDKSTGTFQLNHAKPIAYSHGKYFTLGEKLGGFGFSIKKKNKR